MLNKHAAAEQLRKYATVARLIREQRMMQKQAANGSLQKYPYGTKPPARTWLQFLWDGTPQEQYDQDWYSFHENRRKIYPGYTTLSPEQWKAVHPQKKWPNPAEPVPLGDFYKNNN